MHRYHRDDLYNKYLQAQADEAWHSGCIHTATYNNILARHASKLYTPNFFIRVALALLTVVAICASAGLYFMITGVEGNNTLIGSFIFFAVVSYAALEQLVKLKHYYNAGMDNVLLVSVLGFVASAVLVMNSFEADIFLFCIIMLVSGWLCTRFTDAFMGMLAYLFFYAFVFLVYTSFGIFAQATAPLVMMVIAATILLTSRRLYKQDRFLFYRFSLQCIQLSALLTGYASVNYYVVTEIGGRLLHHPFGLHAAMPLGWVYWLCTIAIPLACIAYGLRAKSFLFLRSGVVLVAATILTIRRYYHVLSAEVAMLVAGLLLIIISYVLMQWLSRTRTGYTFRNTYRKNSELMKQAESLLIAQGFGKKPNSEVPPAVFGGGSSGGGGAGGTY